MNQHDPVDELLERAFQRELSGATPADLAGPVMGRLRRRQRWRMAMLSTVLAAGMISLGLFLPPALDALLASLPLRISGLWQQDTVLVVAGAIMVAAWLVIMDDAVA